MSRVVAIDFGLKRTGLAVTDPLRIIATPLETVSSHELLNFLEAYCKREDVKEFVIGMPKTLSNEDSSIVPNVKKFMEQLKKKFPQKPIHTFDERFTSSIAQQSLIDGGMKKKDRRKKENIDKVSATLILQDFLSSTSH